MNTDIGNILKFKNADQLGIVVKNIEDGMRNFSQLMGVHDWYRAARADQGSDKVFYKGNEIHQENDLVLGYCGNLQIELVQTAGDENIYSTHLEKHGEGLHHLGFFVPDLDTKVETYKKLGVEAIQTGSITAKGGSITRYAYMDNKAANGITIELIETRLFGIHTRMKPFLLKVGAIMGDLEKVKL